MKIRVSVSTGHDTVHLLLDDTVVPLSAEQAAALAAALENASVTATVPVLDVKLQE